MNNNKIKKDFVMDKNDPVQKLLREMRVMHEEKTELDKRFFKIFIAQVEQLHLTSSNPPAYFRGPDDSLDLEAVDKHLNRNTRG